MLNRVVTCRLMLTLGCVVSSVSPAQQTVAPEVVVIEVAPGFHVLAEPGANLVVFVDENASLVAGFHTPSLVSKALELLAASGAPPVRYALIMENGNAAGYGDGGWGDLGAVTLAHERLRSRIGQLTSARRGGESYGSRQAHLPALGFSRVVQISLGSEQAHFVHDHNGATDADAIVHFESAGILLLGGLFTTDGYPAIHLDKGGSLEGMIRWVDWFCKTFQPGPDRLEPIIPGRGPVSTFDELGQYRDMLVAVRDRITGLVKEGRSLDDVISSRPTADFDQRWARGPVSPDQFTKMVYDSIRRP